MGKKVPSDLEIAQAAELRPIIEIAEKVGLEQKELVPYGWYKAKVQLDVLERLKNKPNGKYIDVTAITPTPLGEGKSTTTIGFARSCIAVSAPRATRFSKPQMVPRRSRSSEPTVERSTSW